MVSWKKSGMALGELVEEYVNRERSLLQICAEWGISPGAAGAGAMSTTLKQAGYTVRSSTDASTARKRVVQGNMEERLGMGPSVRSMG